MMTQKELYARCKDRVFDQITLVTDNAFTQTANLISIYQWTVSSMGIVSGKGKVDGKESYYTAYEICGFVGDIELRVVQPITGDTSYKRYLDRFGAGLCCLREVVPQNRYGEELECYKSRGLILEQEEDGCAVFDLKSELGILYAVVSECSPLRHKEPEQADGRRICQINITCKDIEAASRKLIELLDIGPYEIGHINPVTVTNLGIRVDGRLEQPEFEYLLGMNCCGNLEIELIAPVKGPNCFADYMARRPEGGFNHLKEVVPTGQWEQTLQHYANLGMKQCIKGKIGPCGWCFMNTEKELGFLVELGDGVPMTKLPNGYDPYFIPAE